MVLRMMNPDITILIGLYVFIFVPFIAFALYMMWDDWRLFDIPFTFSYTSKQFEVATLHYNLILNNMENKQMVERNGVHISKMTGKLEGFQAISTNTITNEYCMKQNI